MAVVLTPKVAQDIQKIIRDHHAAIAGALFGKDSVDDDDWDLAVKLGLTTKDAAGNVVLDLHQFGAVLAHVDQSDHSRYGQTWADFIEEVERNPQPMTEIEVHSANHAAKRAARHVVGLGNRMHPKLTGVLIGYDDDLEREMRSTMRDVIAARFGDEEAAERMAERAGKKGLGREFVKGQFRATVGRMKSDLGHLTDDWARDMQRIAQTEFHVAVQEGMKESWRTEAEAQAAESGEDIERIRVYKLPRPDACKHCKRLHLDQAGNPRIFYLDHLEGNGNNVGRKADEWQAVVGSVHPWCACQLVKLPRTLSLPAEWRSGQSVPSVLGPGGSLVGMK